MGLVFWQMVQAGMDVQRCMKKGMIMKWGLFATAYLFFPRLKYKSYCIST